MVLLRWHLFHQWKIADTAVVAAVVVVVIVIVAVIIAVLAVSTPMQVLLLNFWSSVLQLVIVFWA